MQENNCYDYIVIGGGTHGLSIAYQLQKNQNSVALLERFAIGHTNGSSHGVTRLSRSAYNNAVYKNMNNLSTNVYWPQMQKLLNFKFIHPNEFAFMDVDPQTYKNYEEVAQKQPQQFIFYELQEFYKKYPRAPKIKTQCKPFIDTKASIISAGEYVQRLGKYIKQQSKVQVYENIVVKNIITENQKVKVTTTSSQKSQFYAKKIVVACGKWITEMYQELKSIIFINQEIPCYLKMKSPELFTIGNVSAYHCNTDEGIFYGIPDHKGQNFKICEHVVNKVQFEGNQQRIARMQKYCKKVYGDKYQGINRYQECCYTMTKSEDFIMDWIDPEEKILICSCCSGHGFKFSPLIGKLGADILVENKSIPDFEGSRQIFQINYHKGMNLTD